MVTGGSNVGGNCVVVGFGDGGVDEVNFPVYRHNENWNSLLSKISLQLRIKISCSKTN